MNKHQPGAGRCEAYYERTYAMIVDYDEYEKARTLRGKISITDRMYAALIREGFRFLVRKEDNPGLWEHMDTKLAKDNLLRRM